jgi:hypothetical protein
MHTLLSTRQLGTVDLHITRVVFGAWVIVRTRLADQIEGWIDGGTVSVGATDLDEIAAAIRRTEAAHSPQTATALAA